MKKLLFMACAAAALAACSDDDAPAPFVVCPTGTRISFEASETTDLYGEPAVCGKVDVYASGNLAYSKNKVFWAKPYAVETDDYDQLFWQGPYLYAADGVAMFGAYYDDGTMWDMQDGVKVTDTWGGFALSQECTQTVETGDWTLQFDAFAEQGANGTATFAVGYDSNTAGAGWMPEKEYNAPQIDFTMPVRPYRVFLANSAWVYGYFSGEAGDSFVVEITGWLGGQEGRRVTCKLIDGAQKTADWVMVDLSPLGEVDRLTFKTLASDTMAPCYFCLDDLCFD